MSLHGDLLAQAGHLVRREQRRPKQASLRRGISAAYYALFHMLADESSALLISRKDRAALKTCLRRAFGHAEMKDVAIGFSNASPSAKVIAGLNGLTVQDELKFVACAFVDLQQARHQADYDVAIRFTRVEAEKLVKQVEQAFIKWKAIRKTPQADTFLVALLAQKQMRA